MGVQGVWEIVNPAGHSISLTSLGMREGFGANESGRRAFRLGIDVYIWYHHASLGGTKGGENPELRLLFFKTLKLLRHNILPLFIFDGRSRPKVKRGSRVGKSGSHEFSREMKKMLDALGIEYREAEGEAEAELARLNRAGVIDAVMTDDVDAFVFGAQVVIKNWGRTLSGNRAAPAVNAAGKESEDHVKVYRMEEIQNHPDIRLTRGALILIALFSGGDYNKDGLEGCGIKTAHGLALCGFGDRLLQAWERRNDQDFHEFLAQWRADITQELRTNSMGFLPHRSASIRLPSDFPDLGVLANYLNPTTSIMNGRQGGGHMRDSKGPDLAKVAAFCEEKFGDWGGGPVIIKRFRDLLWEPAVIAVLRRAALDADERERTKRLAMGNQPWAIHGPLKPSRADAVGTPARLVNKWLSAPTAADRRELLADVFVNRGDAVQQGPAEHIPDKHPLITKIVGARQHVSTDNLEEYRVEICPTQLVNLASSGIKGSMQAAAQPSRANLPDEDGLYGTQPGKDKKAAPDPHSTLRLWIPCSMMRQVHPGLVEDYEQSKAEKATKKSKGKRKARAAAQSDRDSDVDEVCQVSVPSSSAPRAQAASVGRRASATAPKNGTKQTTRHPAADDFLDISDEDEVPGVPPELAGNYFEFDEELYAESTSASAPLPVKPRTTKGFLFTMRNPDEPTPSEDEAAGILVDAPQPLHHDAMSGLEYEPEPPRGSIIPEAMFDQIMGFDDNGVAVRQKPKPKNRRKTQVAKESASRYASAGPSRAASERASVPIPRALADLPVPLAVPPRGPAPRKQPRTTTQPRARNRSPPTAVAAHVGVDDSGSDGESNGVDRYIGANFDALVGLGAGPSRGGKRKAPARKRARVSAVDVTGPVQLLGAQAPPAKRHKSAVGDEPRVQNLSAPAAPTYNSTASFHAAMDVESDDDLPPLPSALPARRALPGEYAGRRRLPIAPSSSQDSGLMSSEDVIDLTDY